MLDLTLIILLFFLSVDGMYKPISTLDPLAPEQVLNTVRCNCKAACKTKRCSCVKGGLSCSQFCSCFETCENTDFVESLELDSDNEEEVMKKLFLLFGGLYYFMKLLVH